MAKAYATRVGAGPFPSELHDEMGERIRERGGEFGTTTGRPRRTGWLDLVALRYAAQLNTLTSLVITKLDVLSGLDRVGVCTSYKGTDDAVFSDYPYHQTILHHATGAAHRAPGLERGHHASAAVDVRPAGRGARVPRLHRRLRRRRRSPSSGSAPGRDQIIWTDEGRQTLVGGATAVEDAQPAG